MNVTVIGSGTMSSQTRCNQSIMLDDVLIDVGSGTVKKMEQLGIKTKDVNYLLLTHPHADHFVDLPNFLIGRGIRGENTNLLHIVCGKGMREKTIKLFDLTFGDGKPEKYSNIENKFNIDFIELDDGEVFENNNLKITAYNLKHGTCKPIIGFILEKENSPAVGYATDTIMCDNVLKICERANYLFLDATAPVKSQMHMGVENLIEISKRYPEKEIYAIHRGDYEHENIIEINFPEDGDIIEIN